MGKLMSALLGIAAMNSVAFAGSETYSGKEIKQVAPPPCPQWYADNEFNVGLWGTYVFTGNNWENDRYIEADHAWGGGIDVKYFFHRYFGVGIEGWVVDARQGHEDVFIDFSEGIFERSVQHENNAIGAVLGTLTLRYPIPCTRFAPYVFAGGGGVFGGGQRTHFVLGTDVEEGEPHDVVAQIQRQRFPEVPPPSGDRSSALNSFCQSDGDPRHQNHGDKLQHHELCQQESRMLGRFAGERLGNQDLPLHLLVHFAQ